MKAHLRYDMIGAHHVGVSSHPQKVMGALGIKYQHATPQTLGDQWWFWNCEFPPEFTLPKYLAVLNVDPLDCVGWGLSAEKAQAIKAFETNQD